MRQRRGPVEYVMVGDFKVPIYSTPSTKKGKVYPGFTAWHIQGRRVVRIWKASIEELRAEVRKGVWRAKRAGRAVSKIHTVQTLPGGALHPVLDVGPGQAGLASDLAQGDTAAGQEDQPAALSLREFFKEQTLASACFAVSFVPAPLRSASTTLTAKQELLMSV